MEERQIIGCLSALFHANHFRTLLLCACVDLILFFIPTCYFLVIHLCQEEMNNEWNYADHGFEGGVMENSSRGDSMKRPSKNTRRAGTDCRSSSAKISLMFFFLAYVSLGAYVFMLIEASSTQFHHQHTPPTEEIRTAIGGTLLTTTSGPFSRNNVSQHLLHLPQLAIVSTFLMSSGIIPLHFCMLSLSSPLWVSDGILND